MSQTVWERTAEGIVALNNFVFYIFAFLIPAFPILVWITGALTGRSGLVWVLAALLFAIVAPILAELLAVSVMDVIAQIRKGDLFKAVFWPLRSVGASLAIFGAFKLEYALVHGIAPTTGSASWLQVLWEFISTF